MSQADTPALPTQEQRRNGLFRPMLLLIAGALAMLLGATAYLTSQMESGARAYEQSVVGHSWQINVQHYDALFRQLGQQGGAASRMARNDKLWIEQSLAAPMRAATGSSQVFISPARGGAPAAPHVVVTGGKAQLVLSAAVNGGGLVEATLAIDPGMVSHFAANHFLHNPHIMPNASGVAGTFAHAMRDAQGRHVASLTWTPSDPLRDIRARVPGMLVFFLSIFSIAAWYFMRQSTSIASDLIASEARARHLAFHDTLTGMPNRAMMFDRLGQLLAMSRRYYAETAVHCLDLDRFKEVNDLLGHHAGDELIRQVAERVTALCRDSDTVARLGGDEFVILQPDTSAAGASHLAERVLKLFETPFELEAGTVEVGVSIGVTLITNPDIDSAEALRQADLALYGSKEGGRNRVTFFEPDMDAALRMRRGLEADLRKALAEGGLTMVYQPQVDATGHVGAMEALVRWEHPERGAIAPSIFVPLCEESGLILDLGEYIFRRVFEESRDWANIRVAINVSALQLRSPMFMGTLTRLVAEYHVSPEKYEIEITETALLGDDGITRNNIIMLKQEGFSIALDDFGVGYSSLNLLKQFAVDKIKIDRSFVHNLEANEEAEGLVDAIVKLGRALKLDIVAEGVETQHQRDRLAACGCNNFQGYLVSRPVPASELDGLFFS